MQERSAALENQRDTHLSHRSCSDQLCARSRNLRWQQNTQEAQHVNNLSCPWTTSKHKNPRIKWNECQCYKEALVVHVFNDLTLIHWLLGERLDTLFWISKYLTINYSFINNYNQSLIKIAATCTNHKFCKINGRLVLTPFESSWRKCIVHQLDSKFLTLEMSPQKCVRFKTKIWTIIIHVPQKQNHTMHWSVLTFQWMFSIWMFQQLLTIAETQSQAQKLNFYKTLSSGQKGVGRVNRAVKKILLCQQSKNYREFERTVGRASSWSRPTSTFGVTAILKNRRPTKKAICKITIERSKMLIRFESFDFMNINVEIKVTNIPQYHYYIKWRHLNGT